MAELPFDFEIEQMMMKGSTHRATEFTREDKSLVNKMVGGSVTTLDANLVDKMIGGSVETNNARIVEQMVAGSQRSPDEEPPLDFCLPSLSTSQRSKTHGDFKESKSTENWQLNGAPRRVYVDDSKGSDEKGHHETPAAANNMTASLQTHYQQQQQSTISSAAMPKDDRTDNDNENVKELQPVRATRRGLAGGKEMTKNRPCVSNPESRRNSRSPPKLRVSRKTLPVNPAAAAKAQDDDDFDIDLRSPTKARPKAEGRGREGRASFPSYEIPSDTDILAMMLGGSSNKRFDVTPDEKVLIKKMLLGSKTTTNTMIVQKMVEGSKETHNHAIIEKMVAGSKETINEKIIGDMVVGSKYYQDEVINQRKMSNRCLGLGFDAI